MKLFGIEIGGSDKGKEAEEKSVSFAPVNEEDTSTIVSYGAGAGAFYHTGQYLDLDGTASANDADLISKYRGIALNPECETAIDNIVNEAISYDDDGEVVYINLDGTDLSSKVKEQIADEFYEVLNLLGFKNSGYEIFRRWYIDGRIAYHNIVGSNPKEGFSELRYIDPVSVRKVKEQEKTKDPETGADVYRDGDEFYLYTPTSSIDTSKTGGSMAAYGAVEASTNAIRIHKDAISMASSGLLDKNRKRSISYLHKAIRPVNQLRMMEDSLVVYRISRAPERRVFYIDVGNLPKGKAEEYLNSIRNKYRKKMVYDPNTGDLKDGQTHMTMLDDFWLPRKEGGRGTEITTLPGGQSLGQIEDVIYFQQRLYKSLNIPVGRLDTQNNNFGLGRANEITRDELNFQKFIDRLRIRFSNLFSDLLRKQLILKGIMSQDEWDEIADDIHFKFVRDSAFTELKEAELLRERLDMLGQVEPYIGNYFSKAWVFKNVLKMTDDQIEDIKKQIAEEKKNGEIDDDDTF